MDDVLATYKQVEHTLRYLGAVAQQTSEGVAVLDAAGVIQFVNPAWVRMHGSQTANDFIGRPLTAFLTEPARQPAGGEQKKAAGTAFIEQVRQSGQRIGLFDHLKSDGTSFLAQMKVTVVKDEAGRATGFVVLAVDITQRRRLEEKLRDNTRRVVQFAERIAWLQKLLVEARDVEESLTKQASELDADSQELRMRIAQWAQSQEMPTHSARSPGDDTALVTGDSGPVPRATDLEAAREPLETQTAERVQPEEGFEADSRERARPLRQLVHRQIQPSAQGRRSEPQERQYPLNTKELKKVAELGRRLAGLTR